MTLSSPALLAAMICLGGGAALAQGTEASTDGTSSRPGRELARTCQVCHGFDGVGTNPTIPNIGGQSAEYLSKQLQDFRAGRREDPQMSIIASDLTDEDIAELASWYASIEASYKIPE